MEVRVTLALGTLVTDWIKRRTADWPLPRSSRSALLEGFTHEKRIEVCNVAHSWIEACKLDKEGTHIGFLRHMLPGGAIELSLQTQYEELKLHGTDGGAGAIL